MCMFASSRFGCSFLSPHLSFICSCILRSAQKQVDSIHQANSQQCYAFTEFFLLSIWIRWSFWCNEKRQQLLSLRKIVRRFRSICHENFLILVKHVLVLCFCGNFCIFVAVMSVLSFVLTHFSSWKVETNPIAVKFVICSRYLNLDASMQSSWM